MLLAAATMAPAYGWSADERRLAAQLQDEEELVTQLSALDSIAEGDEADDDESAPSRSASAPPLRCIVRERDLATGQVSLELKVVKPLPAPSKLPAPSRRRPPAPTPLRSSRVQHGGIAKQRPMQSKRRPNLQDPHERHRLADLAASRYAVTTWEDVLRFTKRSSATKERHAAWERRPDAWDLVLASQLGALGTA